MERFRPLEQPVGDRRTELERWALILVPAGLIIGFMVISGQRK